MSNSKVVDVDISNSKLPSGWSTESRYESSVYLQSPDGQAEHVMIQYWGDPDSEESQYLVEAMVESDLPGMSASNDSQYPSETFTTLDAAVKYALKLAGRIA